MLQMLFVWMKRHNAEREREGGGGERERERRARQRVCPGAFSICKQLNKHANTRICAGADGLWCDVRWRWRRHDFKTYAADLKGHCLVLEMEFHTEF